VWSLRDRVEPTAAALSRPRADHDWVGGFAADAVQTAGSADRSVQPGGTVTKIDVLVSIALLWLVHDAV